jgi:hypothetical protein
MFRQQVVSIEGGGGGGESRPTPKCQGQKRPWEKENGGFLEGEWVGGRGGACTKKRCMKQCAVTTKNSSYIGKYPLANFYWT